MMFVNCRISRMSDAQLRFARITTTSFQAKKAWRRHVMKLLSRDSSAMTLSIVHCLHSSSTVICADHVASETASVSSQLRRAAGVWHGENTCKRMSADNSSLSRSHWDTPLPHARSFQHSQHRIAASCPHMVETCRRRETTTPSCTVAGNAPAPPPSPMPCTPGGFSPAAASSVTMPRRQALFAESALRQAVAAVPSDDDERVTTGRGTHL